MEQPDPQREHDLMMTRRQFFGRSALGLGTAAMASLLYLIDTQGLVGEDE